ncbi:MAG: hypothetical protein AAFZ01_14220, partial [Pseudomonadota bacterium]
MRPIQIPQVFIRFATALVFGVVLFFAEGALPQAQAAGLSGTWSGSGVVRLNSGGSERVRCRVK